LNKINNTGSICDVPGVKVGHAQNDAGQTGCTVIWPQNGAVAGVDIRGSAPGTREVETLRPVRLVPKIHAILLTGGSAFGLDAAGGVQQFLEERNIGYDVGITKVPIVPAAVIFDLREGDSKIRPDKQMGYAAAAHASSKAPQEGRVGAGCGATVGKVAGYEFRMKGGVGTNSLKLGAMYVGALVVVNSFGDVVDPHSGEIIAGARDPQSGEFINCARYLKTHAIEPFAIEPFRAASNTTLAVVATDALLTKEEAIKIAEMAQDGLSRATRPAHTPFDGDLVFCLSVGQKRGNVTTIGSAAAELVADAIVRAVKIANNLD
jgi:L-aminopeptidase/D-esterase-like protein